MGLWRFVLQVYAAWWNTLLQHYKLLLIVIVYNHKNKIQVDITSCCFVQKWLISPVQGFLQPSKKIQQQQNREKS